MDKEQNATLEKPSHEKLDYVLYGTGPDCLNLRRDDIAEAIENGKMSWNQRPVLRLVEIAKQLTTAHAALVKELAVSDKAVAQAAKRIEQEADKRIKLEQERDRLRSALQEISTAHDCQNTHAERIAKAALEGK